MRIIEVLEGAAHGDVNAAALLAARALAERGHQVTWLGEPGSEILAAARGAGLGAEELSGGAHRLVRDARRIRELARGAEVVHVHGPRTHLAALIALGFGRRRPGAPALLHTCHAGRPGEIGLLARWLMARADALVVRCQDLAFELRNEVPDGRIAVIPGGAEARAPRPAADAAEFRRGLDLEGRVLVGAVSDLAPERHLLKFLRAAELLCKREDCANIVFLVLGRGELAGSLAHWIAGKKLGARIRVLDPAAEPAAPAALDLAVVLSPGAEGSAAGALELAAMGKPLVAARGGALLDLLGEKGEHGRLVRPDSAEEIAAAVAALAADAAGRARLGDALRARVECDYTVDRLGERYEMALAALLERRVAEKQVPPHE
jgi:glycosyltransferase involved in cell wall biosynthesis